MRYSKYYAIFLVALAFTACSEDNLSINSSDAKVSFKNTELVFKENYNVVDIPVVVEGETNGAIEVEFKIEPNAGTIEDENFVVTSRKITIPKDGNGEYFCQLNLIDDGINENDPRGLKVSFANIKGASTGTNAECNVVIEDVDNIPYYKLLGKYNFIAYDATAEEEKMVSFTVELTDGDTPEEKDANSEVRYIVKGFDGLSPNPDAEEWIIEYNKVQQSLSVVKGDFFVEEFQSGNYFLDVAIMPMTNRGAPAPYLNAEWNSTFDKITFDNSGLIGMGLYDHTSSDYLGLNSAYYDVVMEKK